MDVINAAKKISEAGTQMDKMAKTIADQVFCILKSNFFLSLFLYNVIGWILSLLNPFMLCCGIGFGRLCCTVCCGLGDPH